MAASPEDIRTLIERIVAIFSSLKEYEKKEFWAMMLENASTLSEGVCKELETATKIIDQDIKTLSPTSTSLIVDTKKKNEQIKDILISQIVFTSLGLVAKMAKNYLSYQAAGLKAKSDYMMEMINNNPDLYSEVGVNIKNFKLKDTLTTIINDINTNFPKAEAAHVVAQRIKKSKTIAQIDSNIANEAADAVISAYSPLNTAKTEIDSKKVEYDAATGPLKREERTTILGVIIEQSKIFRKNFPEVQKQARIAETAEKAQGYRNEAKQLAEEAKNACTGIIKDKTQSLKHKEADDIIKEADKIINGIEKTNPTESKTYLKDAQKIKKSVENINDDI